MQVNGCIDINHCRPRIEDVANEITPASKKGGISSDSCEDTEGETYHAIRSRDRNVGENM